MESMGVISKVSEPTDWVNSIVLVQKSNGSLRVCLDPRSLNIAVRRAHFMLPTLGEIKARVNGATNFSVLDAKNGYWQIKLTKESAKLCTFLTPFGRYHYNRLPFGINSAGELFCQQTHKYFGDIPNLHG